MKQDVRSAVDGSSHSRIQPRALIAGLELEQDDSAPKLWFAVLAQAFRDYDGDILSEGSTNNRDSQVNYCQRTARAWFLSNSPLMGGFEWIADLFELDAQAVRKQLFSGKVGCRQHPRVASKLMRSTWTSDTVG